MKTWPCFIIFVLLPIAKLRPAIAGYTFSGWGLCSPQLRNGRPPTGKRGFASGITALTLKL
ncbi:hypothetical protein F3B35_05975 [Bacteroides intestinalis]|uniref:Uncharacterized protein n=1 Tax=Bacteroides intestinalis TaxID=329854 RepID=A0A4Q5HGA0_9BACE|nr:hypothetical protein F3B37_09095 [Bacteroides intestinalis]KAA4721898.1 hypothetical protein F3B35_05975 [Bacteroides intestinalis]RHE82274.1 hypothetical protein DW715_10320 [Bacteroides intestinalis]RYT81466.1 hypothetical protein EAJ06_07040 [Bacteroides intestinalis]